MSMRLNTTHIPINQTSSKGFYDIYKNVPTPIIYKTYQAGQL
jgi:hypothetical protein